MYRRHYICNISSKIMNLESSFHSAGQSASKRSKEGHQPRHSLDFFDGMLDEQLEKSGHNEGNGGSRRHRHNFQKDGFRRMLNSSSSNDRLMLPEMRYDSSMELEIQQHFQTQNSQESDNMRRSFLKRDESLSVGITSRKDESSQSLSDCKSFIERLCHEPVERKGEKGSSGCNCKKSKCLKLYCECFHSKVFCGPSCGCYDCGNKDDNQDHQKAIYEALSRNPKAFQQEVEKQNTGKTEGRPQGFSLQVAPQTVRRGCKCRKTKCLKKYCECYNSHQLCGVFCKCEGCENTQSPLMMEIESRSQSRVKI